MKNIKERETANILNDFYEEDPYRVQYKKLQRKKHRSKYATEVVKVSTTLGFVSKILNHKAKFHDKMARYDYLS